MENITAKKLGLVPGIAASLLLLGMTFSSPSVEANTTNNQSISGKQLAWWGWGYGPRYGYYGYYGPRYHRYYRGCGRDCWRGYCRRGCW